MRGKRAIGVPVLLAVLVITSGCGGVFLGDQSSPSPSTSHSPAPTASSASTAGQRTHMFIAILRVENQSRIESVPANETRTFENLSADRQGPFLTALRKGGRVPSGGWDYYNTSRPTYVRYNGTWYRVYVGVY